MAKLSEIADDIAGVGDFRSWIEEILRDISEDDAAAYATGDGDERELVWVAGDTALHRFVYERDPEAVGYWASGRSFPWSEVGNAALAFTGLAESTTGYTVTVSIPMLGLSESQASGTVAAKQLIEFGTEIMRRGDQIARTTTDGDS